LHGLPEQLCRGPTPPLCSDVITRRSRWNLAGPTKPCRPFDSLIYPLGSFPPAHWKRKTQNNQKMVLPSPQLHLCRESIATPASIRTDERHTHTHTHTSSFLVLSFYPDRDKGEELEKAGSQARQLGIHTHKRR
jgi:hypothetical protein